MDQNTPNAQQLAQWETDLDDWGLTQLGDFFVDDDTGQTGAMVVGWDVGSVPYFRAV